MLISPKVLEGLVFLLHNIRRVFGKIFRIIRHLCKSGNKYEMEIETGEKKR